MPTPAPSTSQTLLRLLKADALPAVLALLVLANTTAMPQAQAGSVLNQGIGLYQKGRVTEAVTVFKRAVKQQPQAQSYLWLGKGLKRQGPSQYQNAVHAFEQALMYAPGHPEASKELAELYSWRPHTRAKALELYENYLNQYPQDKTASKNMAQLLIWEGRYMEAEPIAERVAPYFRGDKSFLQAYAQMLTYNGRAPEGLQVLEERLGAHRPNSSASVQQLYVAALVKAKRYEQAKSIYQSLLGRLDGRWSSTSPEAVEALSAMAYELKDYPLAVQVDTQLLQNPRANRTEVTRRLARSYAKLGEFDQAFQRMDSLREQGRLNNQGLLEYADLVIEGLKQHDPNASAAKAEGLLQEAQQQAPEMEAEVGLRMGRLLALGGGDRFDEATHYYLSALKQKQNPALVKEWIGLLQSAQQQPRVQVIDAFEQTLQVLPKEPKLWEAYADYLSWDEGTRIKALETYAKLGETYPSRVTALTPKLDEVLGWHQAKRRGLPLYQHLANVYPDAMGPILAQARAYWQDKAFKMDARKADSLYQLLLQQNPNNSTLAMEYGQMLGAMSGSGQQGRSLQLLKNLYQSNPSKLPIAVSYANALASAGHYDEAANVFGAIVASHPNSPEAALGKGQNYLWSGNAFAAKRWLSQAHAQFPNNADITLALAEANKAIGAYGEAMKLMEEAAKMPPQEAGSAARAEAGDETMERPIAQPMQHAPVRHMAPARHMPEQSMPTDDGGWSDEPQAFAPPEGTSAGPQLALTFADEVAPEAYAEERPTTLAAAAVPGPTPAHSAGFNQALQQLQALEEQTEHTFNTVQQKVDVLQDLTPSQATVNTVLPQQRALPTQGRTNGWGEGFDMSTPSQSTPVAGEGFAQRLWQEDPSLTGAPGQNATLDKLTGLQGQLSQLMRPSFRSGFLYSMQKGDRSTNSLRHWAFPTQMSFMLTPQVRVRAGYALRNFSLPKSTLAGNVTNTRANQYSGGLTWQLHDRVTFDGDLGITTFGQSDSVNVTYQTRLTAQLHDYVKASVGVRRIPLETSFLSFAGAKYNNGPLAGKLVGQVRENTAFAELNMGPYKGWDWNLGYGYSWIDGSQTPKNTKNEAFTNLGYTWRFNKDHAARLAYELLYFGYAKNATTGFYDPTRANGSNPVSTLNPVSLANNGTVLGGYYSPDLFLLNDVRLELRGSFAKKFLEYRIGGAIGTQTSRSGLPGEKTGTRMAYQMNAQLTANVSESFSLYGLVDYINTGGVFDRWRFGGGIIYRPEIKALMPAFGKTSATP